jgi:serine/threonine-protein kinase
MREELREHPASLNMFLGEARLAARMNHPNVVVTSEVGEDTGRYYICMEYLEGQTLSRVLKKTVDQALPLAARLEIMCQMLEGLSYLHGFKDLDGTPLGLVHRDISPNNLFVTFDGTVKVLDFGVAKAAGISHVTEAGTFKGKLGYAAPEQIVGRSDQRSDVFAAGVLMWELLTYRRLTQDRTQTEIVQGRIAGAESELMLRQGSDVPPQLMAICKKAASKAPEDRYPSASAMQAAIRAYISATALDYSAEKLRELLHGLYEAERSEMRLQIDRRVKQAQLEDEHPSEFSNVALVPNAASVFNGTSAGTNPSLPAPAGRGKMFAAALAVALLAGVAGAFITRVTPQSALSTTPPPSAAPVVKNDAESSTRALGPLVRLRLSAVPPNAELILDGAKLEGNPFSGQLAKDGALHRLEVRAPGRKTEARMINLDEDLQLHIELRPLGAAATAEASSAVPTPSRSVVRRTTETPAAGDFSHKQRDLKARPIDNADPYGP